MTSARAVIPSAARDLLLLSGTILAILIWSSIRPHDRFTWFLEVAPVLIGLPILYVTRNRFPLTRLTYYLLAVHAIILMVGGKYTYAEVPFGFWLQDVFGMRGTTTIASATSRRASCRRSWRARS